MEKSTEGLGQMLDGLSIQPPRLEDAGLEDCALPPQSIMEAFSRAAKSLRSRVTSQHPDHDDDNDADASCIQYPGPTNGEIPEAPVGDGSGETLGCGSDGNAVGEVEVEGDEVVVVGGDGDASPADRVLVLGGDDEGGEKACCPNDVGGAEAKKGFKGNEEEEEEEEADEDEKPILVEALI